MAFDVTIKQGEHSVIYSFDEEVTIEGIIAKLVEDGRIDDRVEYKDAIFTDDNGDEYDNLTDEITEKCTLTLDNSVQLLRHVTVIQEIKGKKASQTIRGVASDMPLKRMAKYLIKNVFVTGKNEGDKLTYQDVNFTRDGTALNDYNATLETLGIKGDGIFSLGDNLALQGQEEPGRDDRGGVPGPRGRTGSLVNDYGYLALGVLICVAGARFCYLAKGSSQPYSSHAKSSIVWGAGCALSAVFLKGIYNHFSANSVKNGI